MGFRCRLVLRDMVTTTRSCVVATLIVFLVCANSSSVMASFITVKPIQVAMDDGTMPANNAKELFSAFTTKIWAQAGITVNYLPFMTLKKTSYQNFTTIADETAFFNDTANNMISTDPNVITMWFVKSLTGGDFGTVDAIGGRKVMIADNVFSTNRYDTLAHELGHNLGLTHTGFGAGGADNLMTTGGTRTIPGVIGDVNPDGAKLDKLTAAQIAKAMSSPYCVPEPMTLLMFSSGFGILVFAGKRKRYA